MAPKNTNILAPHPVHPRAIRNHGMFGESFVKQHMVIDDRWSAVSLIEEFHGMTNLLKKRFLFETLEGTSYRKSLQKSTQRLRVQCRDGRMKLQNVLFGNNVMMVRNFLINHKDMQRLYQKMHVNMVMDNINQRTFVMRKEHDRLNHRLAQLKDEYHLKLTTRAELENRIKYQNEFMLDEELTMREISKFVENSNARLRGIKAINSAYKKIIEVLMHDAIFYEPIMRSLNADIDDQASFIKHILYLGTPAIAKFKQLSEEFRQLSDKTRKSSSAKWAAITNLKKSISKQKLSSKPMKEEELVIDAAKHYCRETKNMLALKNQLEKIETIIKQIKEATLCSAAPEIFTRIKSQVESNYKLIKKNDIHDMQNDFVAYKKKVAEEQKAVLINSYFEDEEMRLERIKKLKSLIKEQDDKQKKTMLHLKERGKLFVVFRYHFWNLSDIMRHVGRTYNAQALQYPNTYLKLPLLKFEMLTMYAVAPEVYEENIKTLLTTVTNKLKILIEAYNSCDIEELTSSAAKAKIPMLCNEFHKEYLLNQDVDETADDSKDKQTEDEVTDTKTSQYILNRKQIKSLSARVVEENLKKDEM